MRWQLIHYSTLRLSTCTYSATCSTTLNCVHILGTEYRVRYLDIYLYVHMYNTCVIGRRDKGEGEEFDIWNDDVI